MFNLTERQLRNTLLAFLRPLSKLLLIAGIDAREFIEIAKSAYVDTATNDFGNNDKPASVLRVSEVTGLTRADVKRIRELEQDYGEERVHDVNHDSFVLHEWFRDPTYHDSSGQPRTLSFGPGAGTFCDLVARAAPDRDPEEMLERLVRLGNIRLGNDGEIEPVSRTVLVAKGLEQAVYTIEWGLLPIMTTTLFLRPLSKMLLIAGIDAREFIEITKSAYVDTATSDFGNNGKRCQKEHQQPQIGDHDGQAAGP